MTLNCLIFIKISTFYQLISDSAILSSLKLAYNGKNFHMRMSQKESILLALKFFEHFNECEIYLRSRYQIRITEFDCSIHCSPSIEN